MRGRFHDLELGDGGVAQALDRFQPFDRCRHDLGKRAELLDQVLGERLEVAARDGAKEHELEQLVNRQGIAAALEEARAQPLAMPEKVRGRLGWPRWFPYSPSPPPGLPPPRPRPLTAYA